MGGVGADHLFIGRLMVTVDLAVTDDNNWSSMILRVDNKMFVQMMVSFMTSLKVDLPARLSLFIKYET